MFNDPAESTTMGVAFGDQGHVSMGAYLSRLLINYDIHAMLENLSREQKVEFTQMIMAMLDDWGVSHSNKLILLALPDSVRVRMVRKYYIDEPLPDNAKVFERIDHLMGIADALRTSFPLNYQMASFWLNQKNQRFNDQTPLEFMLQGGIDSVVAVRSHLDCAWDWNQNRSESES